MKMLSRRMLLASTVLLPVVGCTSAQVSAFVTDVGLISTGLQAEAAPLATLGVPTSIVSQITSYMGAVSAAGSAIVTAGVLDTPNVQTLETALNSIVAVVSGTGAVNIPQSFLTALSAAEALLPAIVTAVGLAGAPAKAVKGAPSMAPASARVVLTASAAKTAKKT